MTYQETKCHLESIPNAKRLSDAYVCLRVQDVKKLFLFTTTLTFLSFERCCCVVEAQLLGGRRGARDQVLPRTNNILDRPLSPRLLYAHSIQRCRESYPKSPPLDGGTAPPSPAPGRRWGAATVR